ncbi:MAG: PorT family protein [Bacteroidales bacterium]|nr:PorT family protein [Bacteroidales bacterium]
MKKIMLLILLIVSSIAQKSNAQLLKDVGIKTGICFSNQNWTYKISDRTYEKDYRTSLNLALSLEWFDNEIITLVTDVRYIQKGFQEEKIVREPRDPEHGRYKMYKTRFDYLTFSPQLKVRKEINKVIPYVYIGPRIDYYLSYESDYDLSPLENDFKRIIVGLNYGLGISYRIKDIGISVEFTHFYDFTDVLNTQTNANMTGIIIKNNAYAIDLGINYFLKQKEK